MFSPFRDTEGKPKEIEAIGWGDLGQLRDAEEGFALEFKQNLDANVEGHLPKIIASFANSKGGWIVIGIRDSDKAVCPIPKGKADYSQMIGELCRRHVSPAPRFDMRFVEDTANADQGVLVIEVFEGEYPPYVADGLVEVRVGSSTAPAEGDVMVDLYGKSMRSKVAITSFCTRTIYYHAVSERRVPLFDLYLYHQGRHTHVIPSRSELNERCAAMRACFERQGMEFHCQHAHDSHIFRTSTYVIDSPHSAIELFDDESMKLSVPAVLLEGDRRRKAVERLHEAVGFVDEGEARIISAEDTLTRVTRMATLLDRYARMRNLSWSSYAIAYELENLAGVLLFSPKDAFRDYVRSHDLLFCGTIDGSSRVRYVDEATDASSFQVHQFAGSHFFEACGLPLGSDDPADVALLKELLKTD